MKTDNSTPEKTNITMRWELGSTRTFEETGETITWAEFVDANRDGMELEELSEIRATVERGETYIGGGGSAPLFSISPAKS